MSAFFQQLNLTGRILVSFWITLVLVIVSAGILFALDRDDSYTTDIRPPKVIIELSRQLMEYDYDTAREWFAQQPVREQKKIFVSRGDEEILYRRLPRAVRYMHRQLSPARPFIHKQKHHKIVVGRLLMKPDGEHVKIVALFRAPHPPWRAIVMDNLVGVLLFAVLISGLISYVLARYISKPIRSLRDATKQLAAGDLSVRVMPSIRKHKDEIYHLAKDFDDMAEKLERSVEAQKRLIQDISHELRSPIARLQIALELTRKRLQDHEQQDLDRIENECQQLNDIITSLLNLPAYELQPELALGEEVDVASLIQILCDDLNYSPSGAKVEFTNQLSHATTVRGNGQLLRSALENVMKNAQHYTEGEDPIRITLEQEGEELEILCCDNGPGIPENKVTEIFKPFYRTSEARERSSGGHGLGLAIAKRAIDLHQGKIKALNTSPKGLCIQIRLPVSQRMED